MHAGSNYEKLPSKEVATQAILRVSVDWFGTTPSDAFLELAIVYRNGLALGSEGLFYSGISSIFSICIFTYRRNFDQYFCRIYSRHFNYGLVKVSTLHYTFDAECLLPTSAHVQWASTINSGTKRKVHVLHEYLGWISYYFHFSINIQRNATSFWGLTMVTDSIIGRSWVR